MSISLYQEDHIQITSRGIGLARKIHQLLSITAISLALSAILIVYYVAVPGKNKNDSQPIRIACVGDSITQGGYPYYLWEMFGRSGQFTIGNYTMNADHNTPNTKSRYSVGNFGVGGTMVTLKSETPYMNTSTFQSALKFQPDIVVVMLGTNDAQPGVHQYNASFVDDYKTLINAFQTLSSKPKIWIVLPPPIFDSQSGKTSPEYLEQNVIPHIEQLSKETTLPLIDVHSASGNYPNYFPDGIHPNIAGAQLIANVIYKAII